MTAAQDYRWPTKLRRYGITDPFLKILVAKYEREIPWETEVRDSETLFRHVRQRMLPKVLARVRYPPNDASRRYYVDARHVDLELALDTDPDLDNTDIGVLQLIRHEDGDDAAATALVELVNERKAHAIRRWSHFFRHHYDDQPAFAVLLLRPLFDLAGSGSRRAVVPPFSAVVEWLHRRIASGQLSPDDNVGRWYCLRLGGGNDPLVPNGWQFIPQGRANAPRLAALAQGSGWCVADESWAADYLAHCDFYILRQDGRPVVALRVRAGQVHECQGRYNSRPDGWLTDIGLFLQTQGLQPSGYGWLLERELQAVGDLAVQPLDWWRARVRLWPFAALAAPPHIADRLLPRLAGELLYYADFPAFPQLVARAGLSFTEDDWRQLVAAQPERYAQCPDALRASATIRQACTEGWLDRLDVDALSPGEMARTPDFVQADRKFQERCLAVWMQLAETELLTSLSISVAPEFVASNNMFRARCLGKWKLKVRRGRLSPSTMDTAPDFVAADEVFRATCIRSCTRRGEKGQLSPMQTASAPDFVLADPGFRRVCVQIWASAVQRRALRTRYLGQAPEFVKADAGYRAVLAQCLPYEPHRRPRRSACNPDKDIDRLDLARLIPPTPTDSPDVAVEHVVSELLHNEDGIFVDRQLPDVIRQRPDFAVVRERGWRDALRAHPPLWFALPPDLAGLPAFQPIDGDIADVDLDDWVRRVTAEPWLLTEAAQVPEAVRHHRRVLEAYREGWLPLLRRTPWHLGTVSERRDPRREDAHHISYALLYDTKVIDALTDGWGQRLNVLRPAWGQASIRMQHLAPVQLSVLRAIFATGRTPSTDLLLVVAAVAHNRRRCDRTAAPDSPVVAEIRRLIQKAKL